MDDLNLTCDNLTTPIRIVGESSAIKQVLYLINQVANSDTTVLICGESGTGKEDVARALHEKSKRRNKLFIPINCGAIPHDLLESELFGHVKGAFTGAIQERKGRFELAEGGTLFLDEIGDMPLAMQVKLLRVLQERCFERVGSNKTQLTDVRIIAATHRNLEEAIENGEFREDLYYRLNVFPIDMPPLRDRIEDLPLLINQFVSERIKQSMPGMQLLPAAQQALKNYPWSGNVRELVNLVERLSILYPNGSVDVHNLPKKFQGSLCVTATSKFDENNNTSDQEFSFQFSQVRIDLKEYLNQTEKSLIKQALDEADWVVTRAASFLGVRRTTLVEKIKKHSLSKRKKASAYTSRS